MSLGSLGSAIGLGGGSSILGTMGAGLLGGGLGYMGVKDTNDANAQIASARNIFERDEAKKARLFSKSQAAINRQFQEQMSSSAVSRRMADMKKAGINPILAGKYDASTPAGGIGATAKANAHGYTAENKIQGGIESLSSSMALLRQVVEMKKITADTKAVTSGLPKKGFFEQIWQSLYGDMQGFKDWTDKYQNDAKSGKGVFDNADAMLENMLDQIRKLTPDKRSGIRNKRLHIQINKDSRHYRSK